MEYVRKGWMAASRWGRKFGPYLLIEAIKPGGTLVALLLYAWRQRSA